MNRRSSVAFALFFLLGLSPGGSAAEDPLVVLTPIANSAEQLVSLRQDLAHALWAAQDADGGWHSQTYAVLRGGHALTALLLAGLVALPQDDDAAPMGARARALAFLRAAIDSPAGLGNPTDQPREYPTSATAFALLALVRADEAEDTVRRSRLIAWLKACQRSEQNGFAVSHRAFGGWGFTVVDQPGFAGHTDLAHTRWALSALAAAGALDDDTATRATHFLALCQRRDTARLPPEATPADGGLYLSPVVWPANKGGPGHWSSSYASATADGVVALLLVGDVVHAREGFRWLDQHPGWDRPAGIPPATDTNWAAAVRCYHLCARANAYARRRTMLGEQDWHDEFIHALPSPRGDGLYANPEGFLMKEDDPLIASGLILHALAAASGAP